MLVRIRQSRRKPWDPSNPSAMQSRAGVAILVTTGLVPTSLTVRRLTFRIGRVLSSQGGIFEKWRFWILTSLTVRRLTVRWSDGQTIGRVLSSQGGYFESVPQADPTNRLTVRRLTVRRLTFRLVGF
jgi:hypothetical protein